MGSVIDVALRTAGFHTGRTCSRVDAHASHPAEVDHQTVVDASEAGPVVAATANGDRETVVASEIDGCHHVGCVSTLHYDQRTLVNHGVEESARFLVARLAALDHEIGRAHV